MLLLEGKPLADKILAEVKGKVDKLDFKPQLAAVLASDNEASRVYLNKKQEAAQRVGIRFRIDELPKDQWNINALVGHIKKLNSDSDIHGIIVQSPLADPIDENIVFDALDVRKDVDGLHSANIGRTYLGLSGICAATPKGIIELLKFYNIPIAGKHVVVVGRSRIVGKPLAGLLLAEDATVTICHSKTPNLKDQTQRADILVVAIGQPDFITKDMIHAGAVVVDAGWSRINGQAHGDVDPAVQEVASAYTPVPGGVGPVTVAMLLKNTIEAYSSK